MDFFARAFLVLNGLVFIGLGVHGLMKPVEHMAIFDAQLYGTSLLSEIRANYGGMHVGMGLFFLLAAWWRDWRAPALAALSLFLLGLAAGRLWAWSQDGAPNDAVLFLLGLEVVAGWLAWWLLRKQKAPPILL